MVYGGGGNDIIVGTLGDDMFFGGAGHDHLWGGEGFNILNGGKGHDELFDIYGGDEMFGGPGYDSFNIFFDYGALGTESTATKVEFPIGDPVTIGINQILVGDTVTGNDILNTKIIDFTNEDRIVIEATDTSCPGGSLRGYRAKTFHSDEVTGLSSPLLVSVMSSFEYSICEMDPPMSCITGTIPCGTRGLDFSATEVILPNSSPMIRGRFGDDTMTGNGINQTIHGGM